jgi:lysozyme
MQIVEKRTGKRPILYVNQMFINNHMTNAADIKQRYHVWIARYSQYKPDVKLIYWQLCPDGRVNGINGDVDINVFNGYQGEYEEFKRNVSTSNKP